MSTRERPLSPHLQVYRLPIIAITSIMHRITGVGLIAGLLMLTWWLASAAAGPDAHASYQAFASSWFGLLLLIGFTWAFFYHLCNGIRHLFWDAGYGFEIEEATKSSWLAIIASVALTVLGWFIILAGN